MRPIRTLIVDDEPIARRGVRVLLEKDSEIEIVGECGDGREAVRAIRDLRPDLLFLDVQMPEMDGFETLERIDEGAVPVVIFVTAYDRYALRAFEAEAFDYLLKPFDDDRFRRALERAKRAVRTESLQEISERVLSLLQQRPRAEDHDSATPSGSQSDRIVIRSSGRVVFLDASEIDWVEAADCYVRIHAGEDVHLLRRTLSSLERDLDPERFLRVHRSAIVNTARVRELLLRPQTDPVLVLDSGEQLRVSRSRREEVLRALDAQAESAGGR